MSNRAIAQALFVTVKTVEVHLASTYRKLAIPSRTALAEVLAPIAPPLRVKPLADGSVPG
jgi:DNA-binding NarL/FixJ family response regulator